MNRVRRLVDAEWTQKLGFTGTQVTVAVLDSGMSWHPDLSGRILCFADFVGKRMGMYDDYGHGTHVGGILGGSGKQSGGLYRGIAPDCLMIPVKVLDFQGNGRSEDVIRGIHWVVQNREKYRIRVMNISVGALTREEKGLSAAVEYAWNSGLVVVAAAGNRGPGEGSVTSPGCNPKVITVGASDDSGQEHLGKGVRRGYSGRGPTRQCIVKPEILAPGSGICSLNAAFQKTGRPYVYKSGTSMSTPVVSGAVALLLQKEPELTNVEIKIRLKEFSDPITEENATAWGQLNVRKLLSKNFP